MDLQRAWAARDSGSGEEHRLLGQGSLLARSLSGRLLRPRTLGQQGPTWRRSSTHDSPWPCGPAGSGKPCCATVRRAHAD